MRMLSSLASAALGLVLSAPCTASDGWQFATPLPQQRDAAGGAADPNGNIYVVGGAIGDCFPTRTTSGERLDAHTGQWESLPHLSVPRAYPSVAWVSGYLYAIGGGLPTGTNLDTVERLDTLSPGSGWQPSAARLNTPRSGAGTAVDHFGRIYVIGGHSSTGILDTVEVYDPARPALGWRIHPAHLTEPRGICGAATDRDGAIYAIGGIGPGGTHLSTAERFDPSHEALGWRNIPSMPGVASNNSAAALGADGAIYVAGGWEPGPSTRALRYDPETSEWSILRDLNEARSVPVVAMGPAGYVYAIGGSTGCGGLASVERVRTVADQRPIAVAGPDQILRAGATVPLDGGGSYDDNTPSPALLYSWSFLSRPAGSDATLLNPAAAQASFTPDVPGTYVLHLTVQDSLGQLSQPDEIVVSSANLAPTARAGDDVSVVVGTPVLLDGSASDDPEFDPLSYSWTLQESPAGSQAALIGDLLVLCTLIPDVPGTYTVQLVVDDGLGPSEPDSVAITAISGEQYAENLVAGVMADAAALPPHAVTTKGNQQAFVNHLRQAIEFLQAGDLAGARKKLEDAIARTDGCVLRSGAPDGNGPGRDWIVDCSVQSDFYSRLADALDAISP